MRLAWILAAAFALLTLAVAAHALRPVDRYAIDHLQPFSSDDLASTIAPALPQRAFHRHVDSLRTLGETAAALLYAPADSISAVVLAAGAAAVLRLRGRRWRVAGVWLAAVAAGLAVEGAGKLLLTQIPIGPPGSVFGVTLNGTYPSGHTIRAVIVAAMATALWPRVRLIAAAWVVYITVLLELGGLHVPSDIAGGFLAGGALACAAAALQSGGRAALQAPRSSDLHPPAGAAHGRGGRPGADRGEEQPEAG